MAFFRYILCGFLSLVLALPFPTLCYADDVVSAGGGVDYAQSETKTEEGNQESPENEQEGYQDSNEPGGSGQQSNSPGATGRSTGDGAAIYVSSDSNNEEGLNDDFGNSSNIQSNGFDPSAFPSEYSDPSFNSYLGYSRDDLQKALEDFSALSETRELTDEENEQATLALFAWYYLGYGSPDDGISTLAATTTDIYNHIGSLILWLRYAFYGQPDNWSSSPRHDYLQTNGLVWYVRNIDNNLPNVIAALTTANSYFNAMNTRLANIVDYQKVISGNVAALVDNTSDIRTVLNTIKSYQDAINTRLANILDYEKKNNSLLSAINQNASDIRTFVNTSISFLTALNERLATVVDHQKTISSSIVSILTNSSDISSRVNTSNSFLDAINERAALIVSYLYDPSTKRSWLQVIGDRFTAYSYMVDAWFTLLSGKIDNLATNETVTTGLNDFDTHILLYLFGNNNGLPAHTEYLDHGLVYYIAQIYEDQKAFFEKALEYFEIYKDRLFYIEYDLVDYGMDIEPGFNRVIEAINTKQFDIQLENADVSINLAGVESRLDTVIAMLGIAGAKDLLETFLGDFNFDASSALAASIQSAMQNVFPFCVPAILKQILGLLQSEGAPPVFDLDIFGSPLVLDFTAYGFIEIGTVTSWLCRISFLILLLVNTKKFIFVLNRGATDG